MLFMKPLDELTPQDILAFCRRFQEGLRVEYKSTLDDSVRRKIPAIVSSFANSYGGVLVVGVATERGTPVEPLQGFEPAAKEEPRLVIESICLQNLNPPLVPRIQVVKGDTSGKYFLIIEVDESAEAPHAIENNRKVYVRTGDASNPYDLADVATIHRLLERRQRVLAEWERFEHDSQALCETLASCPYWPQLRITLGPRYPSMTLSEREQLYVFLRDGNFRGGRFFPLDSLRRHPNGVCSILDPGQYYEFAMLSTLGLFFYQTGLEDHPRTPPASPTVVPGTPRFPFFRTIWHFHRALTCATALYTRLSYRGLLDIRAVLRHAAGWNFYEPGGLLSEGHEFRSVADDVPAETACEAEHLDAGMSDVIVELVHQLAWPMGQGWQSIPRQRVEQVVARTLREL